MRVSVLTPSYNQGRFLDACIRSVQSQTYPDVEHIVIDNCSTDETHQVLGRYSVLPKLRVIAEPDTGQANALNKGFDAASGDIVCWLNSDDYYANDRVLEWVVALFVANPGIDVVCGDGIIVDAYGGIVRKVKVRQDDLSIDRLRRYATVLQPAAFWRRSTVRLDETFDYAFDWLFFYSLAARGVRFMHLPERLAVYRMHGTNKTALDNWVRKYEIFRIQRRIRGRAHPNVWWCYGVYALYRLSDVSGLTTLRGVTRLVNKAVAVLTGRRVYSC